MNVPLSKSQSMESDGLLGGGGSPEASAAIADNGNNLCRFGGTHRLS